MAMFWFKYMKIIKILFIFLCFKFITHWGGGGILAVMAYMGRLCLKGVPFQASGI